VLTYRNLTLAFAQLGVQPEGALLALVSDEFAAQVVGGPETVLGALLASTDGLLMPAFTLRCQVVPEVGPDDNGLDYQAQHDLSQQAEFYRPTLPVDAALGATAEAFRQKSGTTRSVHPLLSFCGWQAQTLLAGQTLESPLEPLAGLAGCDGDLLLLGSSQRQNVAIHYAESLAGRRQFIRWALTPAGVRTCPNMPGCAEGFDALDHRLTGIGRQLEIDDRPVTLLPLRDLIHTVVGWIRQDPRALLCSRPGCASCAAVRASVRAEVGG
jgi:aminoglycoside 3-N-acetyltransferase